MGGARIAKTLTSSSGGGVRHADAGGRPPHRLRLVPRLRRGCYPVNAAPSPASIFAATSSCIPGITWLHVATVMPIGA
jgi:hypothetical protein